jgi:hypothetical protein
MSTINSTSLADMTIRMLERTAMVLAEPAPGHDDSPAPTRFARIHYRGPSQGTILLAGTDGFCRELAASLLGVEPDEINLDREGLDALKEMANIVGGSVILALSAGQCAFTLGLPETMPAPESLPNAPGADCTIVTECGALRVHWRQAA